MVDTQWYHVTMGEGQRPSIWYANGLFAASLFLAAHGVPQVSSSDPGQFSDTVTISGINDDEGVVDAQKNDPKWPDGTRIILEANVANAQQDEPPEAFRDAITGAADTWNAVGVGPVFVYGADTPSNADPRYDGHNQIIFEPRGTGAFAISTVVYVNANGEVVEMDIRVNTTAYNWSAGDTPGDTEVDFRSAMTHELGHGLSLRHSNNIHAVMYSYLPNGQIKTELDPEDIAQLKGKYAE